MTLLIFQMGKVVSSIMDINFSLPCKHSLLPWYNGIFISILEENPLLLAVYVYLELTTFTHLAGHTVVSNLRTPDSPSH